MTVQVELEITIPSTGFAYVNQHMDDGLKGGSVDVDGDGIIERYNRNSAESATWPVNVSTDPNFGRVLIPELFTHTFTVYDGADVLGSDAIQNDNEFKRNPGVAGQITLGGSPVIGAVVNLYSPTNVLVASGKSDVDGWYIINYKHTGRATIYTVKVEAQGAPALPVIPLSQPAELKGNGFVEVNFAVP